MSNFASIMQLFVIGVRLDFLLDDFSYLCPCGKGLFEAGLLHAVLLQRCCPAGDNGIRWGKLAGGRGSFNPPSTARGLAHVRVLVGCQQCQT